ncbi:MAG: hypothetical protein WCR72_19325 [Bacteroidota bacterium]
MKNIYLLITLCVLVLTGNVYAQSKEDIVYMNNGSILRGKVIGNVKGVKTTIEIIGHNIIVVPDSVIKMILMDQATLGKDHENIASPIEMAASVNFYGGSQNSGGFTFITAYRFPFRLSVGGGIGIEWFDHQQIPFIAEVKYSFLKGSFSPYVYALGGYAVPLSQKADNDWTEYHGGPLAGTGAGLRFNFTRRNALVFNIGYRYQKTKTVTNSYPWMSSQAYETYRYDKFNRLTFTFGFLFN